MLCYCYVSQCYVKLKNIVKESMWQIEKAMAWAAVEYHETINRAMTQVNQRLNFGMWLWVDIARI